MAFLDPPAPEHVPRGVVTWPLFGAATLGLVAHVLGSDPASPRGVLWAAIAVQVATLLVAATMTQRLFATGATRARVLRILAIASLAALSAGVSAAAGDGLIRAIEGGCAVLALAILARAAVGFRSAA